MDATLLRKRMVQTQLSERGIKDKPLLWAFAKVPREHFVSKKHKPQAYDDSPLPIGENQTISQPYIAALMTQQLEINKKDRVLEIGTGSGYQTAILAELAGEVCSIERIESLAKEARKNLQALGYHNISFKTGDGTLGWPEQAPYQAIIVTAASPSLPRSLLNQLNEGGRLVIPIGSKSNQVLTLVKKRRGRFESLPICGCIFVPLVGRFGWRTS